MYFLCTIKSGSALKAKTKVSFAITKVTSNETENNDEYQM